MQVRGEMTKQGPEGDETKKKVKPVRKEVRFLSFAPLGLQAFSGAMRFSLYPVIFLDMHPPNDLDVYRR